MEITVLGPGCPKCKTTEKIVRQVVKEMKLPATITKVEDIREMMRFRVMMTPAVAVNGVVRIAGKVPSANELRDIFSGQTG